jgi:hypothetical protein
LANIHAVSSVEGATPSHSLSLDRAPLRAFFTHDDGAELHERKETTMTA